MKFFEYVPLAQRTASTTAAEDKRTNGLLGLVGEAGEVADAVKKELFQGRSHDATVGKVIDQIGDVLWYCAELVTADKVEPDNICKRVASLDKSKALDYRLWSINNQALTLSALAANFKFTEPDIAKIVYMVLCIAERLGYSLSDVMERNIAKLKERYPYGFDADRSNSRYE